MRSSLIISGFVAVVSALAVEKRDGNCAAQPAGSGPPVFPDTSQAFTLNPIFTTLSYASLPPASYSTSFQNLKASTSTSNYMGFILLPSYNTTQCGALCNAVSGCQAINLFFERDPLQDPNATDCPNPRSTTNIKCVLWGSQVSKETATNKGETRAQFQVVVAGSNGYNKNA